MVRLSFSELPKDTRVKLSKKGRKELWHRVEEFGGVKTLAEAFDYSASKIYNWKSKELALPVNFVRQIMGENNTEEIKLVKGPAGSGSIQNPDFPLTISNELLTRVELSVTENSEGSPVYITSEKSLVERVEKLLDQVGQVDYEVYNRSSRFEIRYPKFLNKIFYNLDHEQYLPAMIDEIGRIEDDEISVKDRKISIDDFDQKLYSREKSFEIALQKGDSDKITELMAEESSKVREIVGK